MGVGQGDRPVWDIEEVRQLYWRKEERGEVSGDLDYLTLDIFACLVTLYIFMLRSINLILCFLVKTVSTLD